MPSHAPVLPLLRTLMLSVALCAPVLAFAAPQIVVSIKPLQLIAQAIGDGVATADVVWSQGQDPHHVSLRPSERRLLAQADLVLWTGPMLEQALADLMPELDAEVMTVQDLPGLVLIDVAGQPDPHVWLDTRNARVIALALADALARVDPENAARYRSNLAAFTASLDALDAELELHFANADRREWSVYHHALRYFERQFGLRAPLALADSENNAPGLRTAVQVRAQLQQKEITCMLTEPGTNHAEVKTMLDIPALQLVDADVMGRGADATSYTAYVQALAQTVSACLGLEP